MIKGVITGDIVRSTSISAEWRNRLYSSLSDVVNNHYGIGEDHFEIYRGDSFQIVVEDAMRAVEIAIAIRLRLKAETPKGDEPWDSRMSVGLGEISFIGETISTSDGEAFRNSGREFDILGKRRLAIVMPWSDVNAELAVSTALIDDIISNVTVKQANIVYHKIVSRLSQKDLATKLAVSTQNLNRIWLSGKGNLVELYLKRCNTLISNFLNQE